MIFLVLLGMVILLFPKNMTLFFKCKRKDDLSQKTKIPANMKFSVNVLKRWSFQEIRT